MCSPLCTPLWLSHYFTLHQFAGFADCIIIVPFLFLPQFRPLFFIDEITTNNIRDTARGSVVSVFRLHYICAVAKWSSLSLIVLLFSRIDKRIFGILGSFCIAANTNTCFYRLQSPFHFRLATPRRQRSVKADRYLRIGRILRAAAARRLVVLLRASAHSRMPHTEGQLYS